MSADCFTSLHVLEHNPTATFMDTLSHIEGIRRNNSQKPILFQPNLKESHYVCFDLTIVGTRVVLMLFVISRQQALLAAISEKDANIALLELSASNKKKTQEEVMALKRERDKLMHQLKQHVSSCAAK